MKAVHFAVLGLTALAAFQPQRPEVTVKDGHTSPLMATITYHNGDKRNVMVTGFGYSSVSSHHITMYGPGDSEVGIWLDTLRAIKDTKEDRAVFLYKNGNKRELKYHVSYSHIFMATEDGASENVAIAKIKSIEFSKAPRKDKDGNAMFDQWRYSPFTGEQLPEP